MHDTTPPKKALKKWLEEYPSSNGTYGHLLLEQKQAVDADILMFISLPIFMPIVRELGWDPVWFGVLIMVNLAIGLITPPAGINLYVAANITRLPLERIARAALPFLAMSVIGLAIVAAVPALSLFLPEMLK